MDRDEAAAAFRELVEIIKALRTPRTGCPWDLEQTHHTLRPYLIEEAYELLDAIDANDDRAMREELGDLLLQIVLHAQLADDRGAFSITEVVRGIAEKMVRRHPHVFGSTQVSGAAEVVKNWEQIKAAESQAKGDDLSKTTPLDRLPKGLPALLRAQRVSEKAATMGVDESSMAEVLAQIQSRVAVLQLNSRSPAPDDDARARLERELGELLFNLCQLARGLGINAEDALRACARRFVDNFRNPI